MPSNPQDIKPFLDATLSSSEAEYRFFSEAIPHLVWTTTPDGSINYVNQRCLKYVGRSISQIQADRWLEYVHPDDQLKSSQRWQHAIETGEDYENEYRLRRYDGVYCWFLARAAPMRDAAGQIVKWFGTCTDIHDRKAAETQLQQQALVFEHIYDAIVITDARGKIVDWNQGAERMYGYTRAEAIGQTPSLWHRPEEAQRLTRTILEGLNRCGIWRGELYFVRKDRSQGVCDTVIVALFDEQRNIIKTIGINHDITEHKQAEDALRLSEERFRVALSTSPIAIFNQDLDLRYTWVYNPKLGYDAQAMLGKTDAELINAEDADRIVAIKRGVIQSGMGTREEVQITHAGETYYYDLSVEPLRNADHEVIGITAAIFDLSDRVRAENDRKQAEAALRRSKDRLKIALDAAQMGLWDWNLETGKIVWTEHHARMWGMSPEAFDGHYQTFEQKVHPDDRADIRHALNQAIAQGGNYDVEFRVVWNDLSIRWIAGKGQVFYTDQGDAIRMIGIVRDTTEQHHAIAEREQLLAREQVARAEAETANRIKDEFLAVLSHELRTPLNPILGWSKILLDSVSESDRRLDPATLTRGLRTIERNARLQTQLIEDLLDVSRILRGKLVLNTAPVELRSMITSAIETVRLAADAKNIQLQIHAGVSDSTIVGDAARLQQIIWNLLSNAVKFTPENGRIEVRLESLEQHIQVQVMDTGKGIDPEFLPYVFERFRQADSTTTRKFGGLGLGLAIVRQLVELHGGTVMAQSAGENQGATFTVQFPQLNVQPIHSIPDAIPTHSERTQLTDLRVLVVDDEADSRDFIAFVLEQEGAIVTVAASAIAALQLLKARSFDFLLSDVGMPEMDGYTMMQQVRSWHSNENRQIPAIALTAYAGESDQQQARSAGFQAHIAKPVDSTELIRQISALRSSKTLR